MSTEIISVSWVETDTVMRHKRRFWQRADPPALAWRSSLGGHDIVNDRGQWHTNAFWLNVLHSTSRGKGSACLYRPLAPDLPLGISVQEKFPTSESQGPWDISLIEYEGRTVIRYERKSIRSNFEVQEVIIAERETRRLIRKEERQSALVGGELVSETISDRYRYNKRAPKGTFEMPKWKPVRRQDIEQAIADISRTLSESERVGIAQAIAANDDAWRVGDFKHFSAVWAFTFAPFLPVEKEWRTYVEAQADQWRSWESTISRIRKAEHVGVPKSGNRFQLVPFKPSGFHVMVSVRAVWSDGQPWQGELSFTLVPTPAGLRIIHWDVPIDGIRAQKLSSDS